MDPVSRSVPSVQVARASERGHISRLAQTCGPYLYLLPALLLVGVFLLYPAIYTFYLSFTDWDGLKPPTWVGLDNYRNFLSDPAIHTSLRNTLYWTVGTLVVPVALGFVAALGVSHVPWGNVFKALFFMPYALSAVVIGIVWAFMYNSSSGTINAFLRALSLDPLARTWLQETPLNTFAMIGAFTWRIVGFNMVLFLVGLQNLPKEPIEAARLDGASGWQLIRHIILPMLMPITTVVVVMAIIHGLNAFDIIWVMTQGGPYRSSETLAVTMYRESFVVFHLGAGAAVAVVLSVLVVAASIFYLRVIFREERA